MNPNKPRVAITALAVLVVLGLAGYLVYNHLGNKKADTQLAASSFQVKEIERTQLPDRFPLDLPVPNGATITKNEALTAPDGRQQETRAYTTSQPLAAEIKSYSDYFSKGGWSLEDQKNLGTFAAFAAARNNVSMLVSMNSISTGTAVTITVTLTPAKTIK